MKTSLIRCLVAASCFAFAAPALAQPVNITKKAVKVGGITPGDTPGFPVTITTPGSYRLAGDLVVPAGAHGIVILTDDVTIDLNGFTISGPGAPLASTRGIYAATAQRRITVLNGQVSNFGYGILLTGPHSHIQRVVATGNLQEGIYAGYQGVVAECTSTENGRGITMVQGGVVRSNTVMSNRETGVLVVQSSLVVGNTISYNGGAGLQLDALTGYADNALTGNNGGGAQVVGGKQLGANMCGMRACTP